MMGMPITVEIVDDASQENGALLDARRGKENVFNYFHYVDETFSTYKTESEISRINRGEISEPEWSDDMSIILMLSEETKQRTNGFFDIKKPDGSLDPSGIVKGWAIWNAAKLLQADGFKNFFVDAGGDIQTAGHNPEGNPWTVGIRNPFDQSTIVKTIQTSDGGVATSGTYIRGEHIYNPRDGKPANEIVSLTVMGPNIYEADRFATAAFAMGAAGIQFIEQLPGFEGYMIDKNGTATMTSGFNQYEYNR